MRVNSCHELQPVCKPHIQNLMHLHMGRGGRGEAETEGAVGGGRLGKA